MDDNFYDGHDELYHRAKSGGDRTTRAGCRCENYMVFVCLLCGPLRVPKSTYVTLAHKRKPKFFYFGCALVRRF